MKKSITSTSILLLSALTMTTQAEVESGVYLGVNSNTSLSGTYKAEYENSGFTSESESDIDTTGASLFIGYRNSKNNRFQLSFSSIDIDYEGGGSDEAVGTDLDWQFVYGESTVQPYWGLGFGLYTLEDTADLFTSGDDLKGVSFQLSAGAKFDLHEHFELDASYHIKSIAWQEIEVLSGDTLNLSHTFSYINLGAAIKF